MKWKGLGKDRNGQVLDGGPVLSCVAAVIITIGIVDVAALGKLAPLAGGIPPAAGRNVLSFDLGYARPVSCKLSIRSCSRALSS